jgi:Rad3-related DNA helicase
MRLTGAARAVHAGPQDIRDGLARGAYPQERPLPRRARCRPGPAHDAACTRARAPQIEKQSIVVFDEAHNIDNVCIEALSVVLDRQTISASRQNVRKLRAKVAQAEKDDAARLQDEYKALLHGLSQASPRCWL